MVALSESKPKRFTLTSRFGPPRQLSLTRAGWIFGLFTLGVGAAAVNTGNNLLYLVLGLQLSSIVISGVLSEGALQGLELSSLGSRDARAGESASWWLRVHKRFGRLPSYTLVLSVEEGPARGAQGGVFHLSSGESAEVELRYTGRWRGRFRMHAVRVITRFPFGLFEKSARFELEQDLFVYPKRVAASERVEPDSPRDGPNSSPRAGRGADLLSLRPMAPGDPLSRVHWKKSAQGQGWWVTEREREESPELHLKANLRQPTAQALEHELEQLAAVADLALDRGWTVALQAGAVHVSRGVGPDQKRRVLSVLAEAERETSADGNGTPTKTEAGRE
jgi:uncharacterized protein (DUF58 family)